MSRIVKLTRREMLLAGAGGMVAGGGGLMLGAYLGIRRERWRKDVPERPQAFTPNVFLAVDTTGEVTVWLTKSEMGQGVWTALPMVVAEELEAEWSKIRVVQALANTRYGDQFTAASSSVRSLWVELRQAGATARHMLVGAGAEAWGVRFSECRARAGYVEHRATGRRLSFGVLAEAAQTRTVPETVRLKKPGSFRLLGQRLPRLDVPIKTTGQAQYGLDVRRPGMRFAVIARAPTFGATVAQFDDSTARKSAGVTDVVEVPSGVAVVATTTWGAIQGRNALDVTWTDGPHRNLTSKEMDERHRDAFRKGFAVARREGRGAAGFDDRKPAVDSVYEVPYVAHVPLEPINCTAEYQNDRLEVWAPTQNPQEARKDAAATAGLDVGDVQLHTTLLGGGFGRRADRAEVAEAAAVAKAVGGAVQVVWTREDDIRHDRYRHGSRHRLRARLDDQGFPSIWHHQIASPSMMERSSEQDEVDDLAVDGARDLPYRIPNIEVGWSAVPVDVPMGIWRAVGHSYNAWVVESFLDEIAHAAGKDPVELRVQLLTGAPRLKRVVQTAARRAGWDDPLPEGHGRGVACHACFGSFVAQVAEVEATEDGSFRVRRVVCAVDCGITVNPDTIEAQVEGGIAFGLSAALHERISFAGGAVEQSNFHDYKLLRLDEMPDVEVHIAKNHHDPGGVGELAVPPVAPAVGNAVFAATGTRHRVLPFGTKA